MEPWRRCAVAIGLIALPACAPQVLTDTNPTGPPPASLDPSASPLDVSVPDVPYERAGGMFRAGRLVLTLPSGYRVQDLSARVRGGYWNLRGSAGAMTIRTEPFRDELQRELRCSTPAEQEAERHEVIACGTIQLAGHDWLRVIGIAPVEIGFVELRARRGDTFYRLIGSYPPDYAEGRGAVENVLRTARFE